MARNHLDAAILERLLATDRTPDQNELLFHVLELCPACREAGGWLLELHQAQALPPQFGLIDAALARSRAEAPRLLEELIPLDPQDRLARLQADPPGIGAWHRTTTTAPSAAPSTPPSSAPAPRNSACWKNSHLSIPRTRNRCLALFGAGAGAGPAYGTLGTLRWNSGALGTRPISPGKVVMRIDMVYTASLSLPWMSSTG